MINKAKVLTELKAGFLDIGEFLVKKTVEELEAQGHKATGALMKSVEAEVDGTLKEIELVLKHFKYGVFVEYGVKAERIPFSGRTGARTSKYIQGLIRWVMIKRFTGNLTEAKGIAFAIARKHKKEGMPTRNSYNFARNGRRKFFMRETITRNKTKVYNDIETLSLQVIQNAIIQAINKL